jgi:hypothetical protein
MTQQNYEKDGNGEIANSRYSTMTNSITITEELVLKDCVCVEPEIACCNFLLVESVTRVLAVNGKEMYREKGTIRDLEMLFEIAKALRDKTMGAWVSTHGYLKTADTLRSLVRKQEAERGRNTSDDAGDLLHPVGHGGFKAFNFKQKLLYILLKKFFLHGKSTPSNKVVGIYFCGDNYAISFNPCSANEMSGFEVSNDHPCSDA